MRPWQPSGPSSSSSSTTCRPSTSSARSRSSTPPTASGPPRARPRRTSSSWPPRPARPPGATAASPSTATRPSPTSSTGRGDRHPRRRRRVGVVTARHDAGAGHDGPAPRPRGPDGSTSVCTGAFAARRGRAARRPPRDHALGVLRRLARRAVPGGRRRPRPDLRARRRRVDLGGRDRGDGPRARAGRGGPRPRARAATIARWLVMFLRRPGGQAQFSAPAARPRPPAREPLRELQRWIADHPDADHSVGALAARARHEPAPLRARVPRRGRHDAGRATSRRCGSRRARRAARGPRDAPSTRSPRACGFGSAETMRRAVPPRARRRARPSTAGASSPTEPT